MSDILDKAIGETIDVLQPLFMKPKLTNTLLAKPPFRFIHDIVTATLNATGFPSGYYTSEELDSSNMKESKTAKLAFLDKLIYLVNCGSGSAIEVLSIKIVSGLEPVNTNQLLTAFGRIAQDLNIDRQALVRRCLSELTDLKGCSKSNPVDAVDAVAMQITKESMSARGDSNTEGSGAVGVGSIMERFFVCNEDMDQTRNMIAKIVSKPKCTDTLLSKPPFRFIHDIIVAVGRATQFDLHLIFSDIELESSNVSEKQAKLQFLKKLIDYIELQLGKPIDVNPAKIIAGLEPGRTRFLLQLFTVLATSKVERTMSDGNGMVLSELEKLASKNDVQSYVVNDGPSNSSSLEVPTMRSATSNGTRPLAAFGSGAVEPEGKVRDAMLSTIHCISAEMGNDNVDTNVTTSSFNTLSSSLSVKANTRPATAHGAKPMNGKGAATFPSEMAGSQLDEKNDVENPSKSNFDDAVQPEKMSNRRTTQIGLPLKPSGIDFATLAGAVRHIAESTSLLGQYIDAMHNDLEKLLSERNHWIDVQHD